jgi:hypothetical protein
MKQVHRYDQPYAYARVDVGVDNAFIPLNRIYKPLGVRSRDWVDYDEYAKEHGYIVFKEKVFSLPFLNIGPAGKMFWVYNDHPKTHEAYEKNIQAVWKCEKVVP